jgi:hypothetical protein
MPGLYCPAANPLKPQAYLTGTKVEIHIPYANTQWVGFVFCSLQNDSEGSWQRDIQLNV